MRNLLTKASRHFVGLRPVRWFCSLRIVRFIWRAVRFVWFLVSKYIWWPVKRQVRRLLRMMKRREVWFWLAAWGICAWIGWAILNEGFIRGLMLGMVVASAYIVICFKSPLAGLLIWLLTSRFLTLYIAVKPLQGMPVITGDRYCLIILAVVYLIQRKRVNNSEPNPVLHGAMAVFILAVLLAGLASRSPKDGCQVVLDTYAVPFLVYLFARRWISTPRTLALALGMMMFVGIYFSAIGVPEYFTGILVFGGRQGGWVEEALGTVRSQGPAESPGEFGLIVIVACLLALTAFTHESRTHRKFLYAIVIGLTMVAVAVTISRAVYLSMILALVFMFVSSAKTRRAAMAMVAIGGLCLLLMWGPFTSSKVYKARITERGPIYSRVVLYATSWAIIKDRPLTGVGIRNFQYVRGEYLTGYKDILAYGTVYGTPHNAYLRIVVEAGLLALIPFLTVITMMIVTSIRAYKRAEGPGLLGRDGIVVFLAFTAAMLQNALTGDVFWFCHYLMTVWFFFFGAIVGVHLHRKEERAPALAQGEMDRQKPRQAVTPTYHGSPRRAILMKDGE